MTFTREPGAEDASWPGQMPEYLDRLRFPADSWQLVESFYSAADLRTTETLFAVGNGYLGMRGNVEEGHDSQPRHFHQRFPRDVAEPARRGGFRPRLNPAQRSSPPDRSAALAPPVAFTAHRKRCERVRKRDGEHRPCRPGPAPSLPSRQSSVAARRRAALQPPARWPRPDARVSADISTGRWFEASQRHLSPHFERSVRQLTQPFP